MLAQAVTGTPGHVNSMAESVKHFIRHFPLDTMKPGDAYITNDPWMGTGHLNDFVITTPAFHKGKLVGAVLLHLPPDGHRRHRLRAGRRPTCSWKASTSRCSSCSTRARSNETLMAMIRANTRLPIDTEGDIYSLAACNDVGCQRLVEMMDEFGIDNLDRARRAHLRAARARPCWPRSRKLPNGTWSQRDDGRRLRRADHARGHDSPSRDTGIHVDYTGTSPQSRYGINVPLAYTTAYTVFGLGCVVASRDPEQCRLARAAHRVGAARAAILNAPKPAPVCIRHVIGQMLPDVVFGCLHQIIPDRVPAEGTSCLWNLNVRGGRSRGAGGNYGFMMAVTSPTAAPARGPTRTGCRRPPIRAACGHAGRDRREPDAADLLEEGAAARIPAAPAARAAGSGRSSRSERRRPAVGYPGGIRPHRSSGARARRRPRRRGRLYRARVRQEDARQGLSAGAAGRPAGGA